LIQFQLYWDLSWAMDS